MAAEANKSTRTYAGRISTDGAQKVEALFNAKATRKPVVQQGGDLRARPSTVKK